MDLTTLLRDEPDVMHCTSGQVVFDEGDPGDVMYVVREGAVDLLVGGKSLERVTADGIFGEMALLDTSERSATAIAAEAAVLVRVSRERFQTLVREMPLFALHVMGVLADRLRRTTQAR
jgi:CRP/FNR family cyclic AMP-dependent transcriptional regulator